MSGFLVWNYCDNLLDVMNTKITKSLPYFLGCAFLLFSFPFWHYPLTDGDIVHWIPWVKEIRTHWNFMSAVSDQTHGPLLAWSGAVFTYFFPKQFYFYNLFNLLCGVLGVGVTYFFTKKLWNRETALMATYLFSSSLVVIYLSRTPMYDWPAAIGYFIFCVFYFLSFPSQTTQIQSGFSARSSLGIAALGIAFASLNRFSISLGLAGIYVLLLNVIYRRPVLGMIRDGFLIVLAGFLANGYWLWVQIHTYGNVFTNEFVYDNFGRFFQDKVYDKPSHDYFGFLLVTLIGIFPHTFAFLASLFQRSFWSRMRSNRTLWMLVAGFLPCLVIFSFSGHTKLARYIAYIFPFLFIFFAYHFRLDLGSEVYRKRCGKALLATTAFFIVLMIFFAFKFSDQAQSSYLFVGSAFFLVAALLMISYVSIRYYFKILLDNPGVFLPAYLAVYMVFFLCLTIVARHVAFLKLIQDQLLKVM